MSMRQSSTPAGSPTRSFGGGVNSRYAARLAEQQPVTSEATQEKPVAPLFKPARGKRQSSRAQKPTVANLQQRLKYLSKHVQPNICIANLKGGASKTTVSVYVGSIISEVTDRFAIVLPSTHNNDTGSIAMNAGVESAITMMEFAEQSKDLQHGRDILAIAPMNKFGLRVIAENRDKDKVTQELQTSQFKEVYSAVRQNCDVVLFDTGNDSVRLPDGILRFCASHADVIVFTGTADSETALMRLRTTIRRYLELSDGTPEGETPDAELEKIRQKSVDGVAVVSKVGWFTGIDKLRRYVYSDGQGEHNGFEGGFHTIPKDRKVAKLECDINAIRPATYKAYLQLAIAIYETAIRQQGITVDPPSYTQKRNRS